MDMEEYWQRQLQEANDREKKAREVGTDVPFYMAVFFVVFLLAYEKVPVDNVFSVITTILGGAILAGVVALPGALLARAQDYSKMTKVLAVVIAIMLGVTLGQGAARLRANASEPEEQEYQDYVYTDGIKWIDVDSDVFTEIGYDSNHRMLAVRFERAGEYYYFGVAPVTYADFKAADSLGSYFNKYIKGIYPCQQEDGSWVTD